MFCNHCYLNRKKTKSGEQKCSTAEQKLSLEREKQISPLLTNLKAWPARRTNPSHSILFHDWVLGSTLLCFRYSWKYLTKKSQKTRQQVEFCITLESFSCFFPHLLPKIIALCYGLPLVWNNVCVKPLISFILQKVDAFLPLGNTKHQFLPFHHFSTGNNFSVFSSISAFWNGLKGEWHF